LSELYENPQIIGGISKNSVQQASKLFEKMSKIILPVSSLEAAELIKLIDNTFRDLSFAFSNELALICEMLKLDARECILKSNYKYSRNRIPVPSPGVGGPCLSKDPYILAYVSNKLGYKSDLILHGRWINEFIPTHIALKIIRKFENLKKNSKKGKIFVIGFAFKGNPETDDARKSSTIILVEELKKKFPNIFGFDPVLPKEEIEKFGVTYSTIRKGFENADCIIFMNNHESYLSLEIANLLEKTKKPCIFVDCWSMFKKISRRKDIVYTGVGIE